MTTIITEAIIQAKSVSEMKVMVTATNKTIDDEVDPRFGRCHYFLIVDTETLDYTAQKNEQQNSTGGAGVQAAQNASRQQVEAVITGSVGPNAFQTLSAAGIKIFTGAQGTVKDAVIDFKQGNLNETKTSTVGPHHGMGGQR